MIISYFQFRIKFSLWDDIIIEMSVDKRAGVALCVFGVCVLVLGLVGLSLHQNYCANTAEAEVQRIVFWRERENRTESENQGVEMQAEVRSQKGMNSLFLIFLNLFLYINSIQLH